MFSPAVVPAVQCVSINITNDTIHESDEVFRVTLLTTDEDVILDPNTTLVTILDNDSEYNYVILWRYNVDGVFCAVIAIEMVERDLVVSEGNGSVTVCAVILGPFEQDVQIALSTMLDTAEGMNI